VASAQVNWYGEQVILRVKGATRELLARLALQGEQLAKENIQANNQIDTGFMLNTVYSMGPGGAASPVWESGQYTDKAGKLVQRRGGTPAPVGPDEAAVGCVAEYAVYQELANSFLYRAMELLASDAGGIIGSVGL
jgi:hypothetical protein